MIVFLQVPDQYGTIRAVAEGKGEQILVGTSRNFILRGTFNDGFQVEVQVYQIFYLMCSLILLKIKVSKGVLQRCHGRTISGSPKKLSVNKS